MSKLKRELVTVTAIKDPPHSCERIFDKEYERVMERFDNKKVISISLKESGDNQEIYFEKYLVFYEETIPAPNAYVIESGDLIYFLDINTHERIYEIVEKVVTEDNTVKVFSWDEFGAGGYMEYKDCVLVAKANDLKNVF